jgi:hypothetical protein
MYIAWYGIYRVIIAGLVLYILKLRVKAKRASPTPPAAVPTVPPIVIITISWGSKRSYLFDVLTTVGITCDTKQRAGIEDAIMKDKEELGFHVEGGGDDVPRRT